MNGIGIDFRYTSSSRAKDSARLAKLVRALYNKMSLSTYDLMVTVTGETFLVDSSATSETKDLVDVLNRKTTYVIVRTFDYESSTAKSGKVAFSSNYTKFTSVINKYRSYISKSRLIGSVPYTGYYFSLPNARTCSLGMKTNGYLGTARFKDLYSASKSSYRTAFRIKSGSDVIGQAVVCGSKLYCFDSFESLGDKFDVSLAHCSGAASFYIDDDYAHSDNIFF